MCGTSSLLLCERFDRVLTNGEASPDHSLASELKLFRPLDYAILPYRGHVIGSLGEGLLQCTGESYPHTSSCFPPFRDLIEPIDVGIIDKWSLIGILLYLNIPPWSGNLCISRSPHERGFILNPSCTSSLVGVGRDILGLKVCSLQT